MFKNVWDKLKEKLNYKKDIKNENIIEYETLLPKDNIENKTEFMLDYAINKDKVNNIAVTGGYSTGKSSIINSYFKNKKGVKVISLATFKQKKDISKIENNSKRKIVSYKKDNNVIVQKIEKTIIEKLSYSTYTIEKTKLILKNIIFSIIFTFITILLTTNIIKDIMLNFNIYQKIIFLITYISIVTILTYFITSKIAEFTKIKFKIGDIEIDAESKDTNLFNKNIERLFKIIKDANYKYIVFEDLDRFDCPIIFEHLRDLNITINSALNTPVKFIYAVRDDMFLDENRTKFFDMIYPVVPYVSYENSGEELYKIIESYHISELDRDFITKVCLYVSDIRILKNALNEYVVYKKELENKSLSKDTLFYKKLFAMMLYKNTCSKDFALLQNHEGIMFNIFNNVKEYRKEEIQKIDKKIEAYEKERKEIDNANVFDRNYFIDGLITEIKRSFPNDTEMKCGDENSVSIQANMNRNIFEDDTFSTLKIRHYNNATYQWIEMPKFLEEYLPSVYSKYILLKSKEENRIAKIEIDKKECEIEKRKIEKLNIKEIIELGNTKILDEIKLGKYSSLIRYLVSEGYINENYSDYINRFSEGSIKTNDNAYIISVRSREKLPFNANIDTPNKVIEMLDEKEFERIEILNKTILDTLLENTKNEAKLNNFIIRFQLSEEYIKMLEECTLDGNFKNKQKLLNKIFTSDSGIWSRIEKFIQDEKEKIIFVKGILENINLDILKQCKEKEAIELFISKNNITIDKKNIMIVLLSEFDIKYKNISIIDSIDKKIDYIIENNSYEINLNNINEILRLKNITNARIIINNYECIQTIDKMNKYIDSNINTYLNNVYLNLKSKQNNSEKTLLHLLNMEDINKDLIEKILEKETIQIENITDVNTKIWDDLLDKDKVKKSYTNINKYYEKKGLNKKLVNYINKIKDIKIIVTLNNNEVIENYLNEKLVKEILSKNEIVMPIYKEIVSNTKIEYKYLEVSHLDEEKILYLMEKNIFKFNLDMYAKIRKCSNNIFIKYTKKYIRNIQSKNIKDIDYNIDEINVLILSNQFTINFKKKVIGSIKDEDIENITDEMLNNICNCILENNIKNNLSYKLLIKILNININVEKKVKLIVYNARLVKIDNIEEILEKLGGNYLKILKDKTAPSFRATLYNEMFIKIIKKLGYNIEFDKEDNIIKLKRTKRGNPAV